ncbi:radical SAM protein [Desulfovibrio aminophilus]|nr:radical SAM protein [Desulfovibrio aminophilus]MCM0754544.1 radical SAM protein [Desulfovibrio aminophilus]
MTSTDSSRDTYLRPLRDGAVLIHAPSVTWAVSPDPAELEDLAFDEVDLLRARENILRDRRTNRIDQVELHLTDRCNMRCRYCYVPLEMRSRAPDLAYADVRKILADARALGARQGVSPVIHFHGGEPGLAAPLMRHIVEEHHREFTFVVQTNGTVLTDEDIAFLLGYGVEIGLSLDALGETDADIRRGISKSRVLQSLQTIRRIKGTAPNVIVTASSANVPTLPDTVRGLHGLGVSSLTINPVLPYVPLPEDIIPEQTELTRAYLECVDFALGTVADRSRPLFINNMESFAISILTSRSSSYCEMSPCGAGRMILVVDSQGRVFPCSGLMANQEFCCGSALDPRTSLADLLDSHPIKVLQTRRCAEFSPCSNCPYREICGANCPIPDINARGDTAKPSPWCGLRQALIDTIFNHAIQRPDAILDFISHETQASLLGAELKPAVFRSPSPAH